MTLDLSHPRIEVWTVTGQRKPFEDEDPAGSYTYDVAVCRTLEKALEIKAMVEAEGDKAWIGAWKYDTKGGKYRSQ